MNSIVSQSGSVDYLLVGHFTQDITPGGLRLGGTAAYSGLTARALGLTVGVVTSFAPGIDLSGLDGVHVHNTPSEYSTTFENIRTPIGRIQYLYHTAHTLTADMIPATWRQAPIIHLGPVAQEVSDDFVDQYSDRFIGLTPQGWMRKWDGDGRVSPMPWANASKLLSKASAAVISIEDVLGEESVVSELAEQVPILVVTEADLGARLYWNGDYRHFSPPPEQEIDATGAGDIFATSFFMKLYTSKDPWEAARFATLIAAHSVTRVGLDSVPTTTEVAQASISIINKP